MKFEATKYGFQDVGEEHYVSKVRQYKSSVIKIRQIHRDAVCIKLRLGYFL